MKCGLAGSQAETKAKKEVPKKGCASSKVATAGGAIGGRAGTGGHFQF
jgi:hypothetical protein